MSEHEPECWCRGCTHPHVCGRCRNCICDELRACKQRVLDAAREAVQAELGWEEADPSDDFKPHTAIWKFRALAAIDALKEKP